MREELGALRRAGRGADEAFRQICGMRFLGRREEEVAADLAELLVEHGHSRAEFTIVASGPNAASPHHEPSGRTILPRDVVVMDFGGEVGGYYSDTTRTVVVGEPPEGFEEVYRLVQEAQDAAVRDRPTRASPPKTSIAPRAGSSTPAATASGSSTGPDTASGSRSTSRRTSSRATRRC